MKEANVRTRMRIPSLGTISWIFGVLTVALLIACDALRCR